MEWSIRCDLVLFAHSKMEAVLLYGTCYSTSVYHYPLLGCDSFQRTDTGYHCHRGVRLSLLVIRYKGGCGSAAIIGDVFV